MAELKLAEQKIWWGPMVEQNIVGAPRPLGGRGDPLCKCKKVSGIKIGGIKIGRIKIGGMKIGGTKIGGIKI